MDSSPSKQSGEKNSTELGVEEKNTPKLEDEVNSTPEFENGKITSPKMDVEGKTALALESEVKSISKLNGEEATNTELETKEKTTPVLEGGEKSTLKMEARENFNENQPEKELIHKKSKGELRFSLSTERRYDSSISEEELRKKREHLKQRKGTKFDCLNSQENEEKIIEDNEQSTPAATVISTKLAAKKGEDTKKMIFIKDTKETKQKEQKETNCRKGELKKQLKTEE